MSFCTLAAYPAPRCLGIGVGTGIEATGAGRIGPDRVLDASHAMNNALPHSSRIRRRTPVKGEAGGIVQVEAAGRARWRRVLRGGVEAQGEVWLDGGGLPGARPALPACGWGGGAAGFAWGIGAAFGGGVG